ncbi:cytochrome P450 315a1, mitochondrial [Chelonus insularis]|uniref:cytochrome P450 315a1, mitochondrial n=1 Tax=Chelonus insularis TaxID=460826 RepID=UPI00158B4FE4|nr:cytochrome P450 315a1, mitochondrial [Chelonus insularis]
MIGQQSHFKPPLFSRKNVISHLILERNLSSHFQKRNTQLSSVIQLSSTIFAMFTNALRSLVHSKKNSKSIRKKFHCNKSQRFYSANLVENTSVIPECPKPSFLQSFISLINYDQAKYLHETVDKKHQLLGPIYKDQIGPVSAFFVNSSEAYQKIFRSEGNCPKHFLPEAWLLYNELRQCSRGLLFMDGEEWQHFRRIMNKLLLFPCNAKEIMTYSCQNAALCLAEEWEKYDQSIPMPKLETQLYKWSIEVMMATLMGSSWVHFKDKIINDETDRLAQNLHKIFLLTAKFSLLPVKYVMKLNLPMWRRFVNIVDESLGTVQILVPKMAKYQGDGLLNMMKNEGIDLRDLSRIVADLIIAAGDTTAYSIQWVLYLLATHPDIQDKIASAAISMTAEEIMKDQYLKGVIKESLRLYPTAPFITRILPKECSVTGYVIPQNELIVMSLYSSGRNANNFPRPNEFLPERWIRNEQGVYQGVINAYGSIPFALGARSCIGKKLAEMQMIFTICELMKKFHIECLNKEKIKMILHLISVPSEAIQLKFTKRKDNNNN